MTVRAVEREFRTLQKFIEVYCRKNHPDEAGELPSGLCSDCEQLLTYARKRLEKCPYDPKPKCKNCKTHCYASAYRARIKEVMKFSGMYFVKRGRLDWAIRYFLSGG